MRRGLLKPPSSKMPALFRPGGAAAANPRRTKAGFAQDSAVSDFVTAAKM
jgi:hypothetical protein